jgi:hypothetical protein
MNQEEMSQEETSPDGSGGIDRGADGKSGARNQRERVTAWIGSKVRQTMAELSAKKARRQVR